METQTITITNKKDSDSTIELKRLFDKDDELLKDEFIVNNAEEFMPKLEDSEIILIRVQAVDILNCLSSVDAYIKQANVKYNKTYFDEVAQNQNQKDIFDMSTDCKISECSITIKAKQIIFVKFFKK
jgi:hypothetical protein